MRRAILIAALVLAGLGALAIRVVIEGRGALADGEAELAAGHPAEAIRAFEASARWYLPLAPHVDDAYARLRELAASEHPAVALAAWRAIRSAARATRSLWTPHADDLAAADAAIAKLSAAAVPPGGEGADPPPAGATVGDREAWHLARLARDVRPSRGAAALAGIGIVLWISGALMLVRRGIGAAGGLARRPALLAGATILVGFACWAVGLYNA